MYLDPRAIRLAHLDRAAVLTWFGMLYGNEPFTTALRSTSVGVPSRWIAFEPFGDSEVRLHWVPVGTDGAVPLQWGPRERTCLIPAGPLLAKWPRLEVVPNWVRPFPFRLARRRLFVNLFIADPRESIPSEQRAAKWLRESRTQPI